MCPSWQPPPCSPSPTLPLCALWEHTSDGISPCFQSPSLFVEHKISLMSCLPPVSWLLALSTSVITLAESNSWLVILLSLTSVVPLIGEPFVLLCSQESITALFVFSLHFVHIFVIVSHRGHLGLLMDKPHSYLRLFHMATQVFYPPTPENTVCVRECMSCQCDGSACTTGINNGSCFLWNRSQARLLCPLFISV